MLGDANRVDAGCDRNPIVPSRRASYGDRDPGIDFRDRDLSFRYDASGSVRNRSGNRSQNALSECEGRGHEKPEAQHSTSEHLFHGLILSPVNSSIPDASGQSSNLQGAATILIIYTADPVLTMNALNSLSFDPAYSNFRRLLTRAKDPPLAYGVELNHTKMLMSMKINSKFRESERTRPLVVKILLTL